MQPCTARVHALMHAHASLFMHILHLCPVWAQRQPKAVVYRPREFLLEPSQIPAAAATSSVQALQTASGTGAHHAHSLSPMVATGALAVHARCARPTGRVPTDAQAAEALGEG
jgi:hypothetical protein